MSLYVDFHDIETVTIRSKGWLTLKAGTNDTVTIFPPHNQAEWEQRLYWTRLCAAILAALDTPDQAVEVNSQGLLGLPPEQPEMTAAYHLGAAQVAASRGAQRR